MMGLLALVVLVAAAVAGGWWFSRQLLAHDAGLDHAARTETGPGAKTGPRTETGSRTGPSPGTEPALNHRSWPMVPVAPAPAPPAASLQRHLRLRHRQPPSNATCAGPRRTSRPGPS